MRGRRAPTYTRVYADADGETHFEEVRPPRERRESPTGSVEVEVSDGEVRSFGPGSVLLVEDTTDKGHITRSLTPEAAGNTRRCTD